MVSVSVRHLFYQPMDEKIKTWPLRLPAKETLIWRRHCPIGLLCCSMTSKRSIVSGMKLFHPSVRLTNQKATRVCIRSINQSNRFISAHFFLFCSCDFKVIRKSLYHSYLRNKGSGVQLGKILWSIPTETFLEFLPSRPGNKASVTNVPAPTIPMAKIELCATSASLS